MAEYIKAKDAAPYLTKYIPSVEAIELSEYKKLKAENTELKIKYDDAMDLFCHAKEEKIRLRSNIDKAIKEIEQCKVKGHTDIARLVSLPEVLSIIKRNIGG